jgi:hypothetical protein
MVGILCSDTDKILPGWCLDNLLPSAPELLWRSREAANTVNSTDWNVLRNRDVPTNFY